MKHVAKDSGARTGNWIDTFGFCDVDVDVDEDVDESWWHKDGSGLVWVCCHSHIAT